MNHRIAVDPVTGFGEVTVCGEISPGELPDLFAAAWHDAEYSAVDRAVWNLVDAQSTLRFEDLLRLTRWFSANKQGRGPKKIAVVAPQDVMFGLSRMFDALKPDLAVTVGVFRSEDGARGWLAGY
jgi:hypothetical protein